MREDALGAWSNPPLAYVVAELKTSTNYSLGKALPRIQEILRGGYPRTVDVIAIAVPNAPPVSQEQLAPSPAWQFFSEDGGRAAFVSSGAIALHATRYRDSAEFLDAWVSVLSAVVESGVDSYTERAGLRYIDLLVPSGEQVVEAYVNPTFRGALAPKEATSRTNFVASDFEHEGVAVQVRVSVPAPALMPPNFAALPLRAPTILVDAAKRAAENRPTGFIDTDVSMVVRGAIDVRALAAIYRRLHSELSSQFKATASELALREWR